MNPAFRWLPVRRCHKNPQVVLVCGIGSSVFGWAAPRQGLGFGRKSEILVSPEEMLDRMW